MMDSLVDVLIQNVSDQCVPNLVAARTFRPKKIIWVCSPEKKDVLQRLKEATQHISQQQDVWMVNIRDSEALQESLRQSFAALQAQGVVLFHLTCGTKSMALQGLMQLATYQQQKKVPVKGVVMDPLTQSFDVVFPKAENDAVACEKLSFSEILKVHGSCRKDQSGRKMKSLESVIEPLEKLRSLHQPLTEALKGWNPCSKNEAVNGYFLKDKDGLQRGEALPHVVQQGLYLAQDSGVIKNLRINKNRFFFDAIYAADPVAYIRNMWMEDWVGAVLQKHDDGKWCGGFSSVKVSIKQENDCQEFDFLGARNNHLVYWSCKNTKEIKLPPLFEIDALRDEVGGRDFHVAGLVHTANIVPNIAVKAKRLGVQLVQITSPDAEEKLVRISCR